ncbi:hypothetical protein JR338_10335 [Chloroflexota bacterium]|nr:hypothetical protein JR338_10335 [Chloroflexota bacterium]
MQILSVLAFVLIVITAMSILVFRDWRIVSVALVLQYLGAFTLVTQSWPVGMAVVKLIVGWMATAAISLTYFRRENIPLFSETPSSFIFRGLIGLLVILTIFIAAPKLQANMFPGLDLLVLQGGLMLVGLALMQLGTTQGTFLTIVSLLSLLSGFEIIYAGLELSTLLTGLLAIVNLGLSLVGVYFIVKINEEVAIVQSEEDQQ